MVQIIGTPRNPSFGERFSETLAQSLPDAFANIAQRKRNERQMEAENEALVSKGIDAKGISDPKIKQALLENQFKSQQRLSEAKVESQTTDTIRKYFGNEAAEVYPILTEGGKTKLTEQLLDDKIRGMDLKKSLGNFLMQNPEDINTSFFGSQPNRQETETIQENRTKNIFQPSVGRTPKEIQAEESAIRKSQHEHEAKRAEKVLEDTYESSKNIPIQQANLDIIRSASEHVGGLSRDFLADYFHFEPLRTAQGSQLKSAGKDLFLKTVQSLGAKPNQWIEQQIGSALTDIGKTKESNQTIAEMAQFQLDLLKKKVESVNQLEDKYKNELGYVPGNIGRQAEEMVKQYAIKRQDEMAYNLREIYEREKGLPNLAKENEVPKGTPLTKGMARELLKRAQGNKKVAEKLAEKIGYVMAPEELYLR